MHLRDEYSICENREREETEIKRHRRRGGQRRGRPAPRRYRVECAGRSNAPSEKCAARV